MTEERFLPSKNLADRIIEAIAEETKFGDPKIKEEDYVEINPQEFVGRRIFGLTSTLAYRCGVEQKGVLRIGENGHFSDEFLRMLSEDRLPVLRGNPTELYSTLYNEFYQYVKRNNNAIEPWGRLTADERGISVLDIKSIIPKDTGREGAKIIGGIGF